MTLRRQSRDGLMTSAILWKYISMCSILALTFGSTGQMLNDKGMEQFDELLLNVDVPRA
ncbi:hypothetical protein [Novosphingobium sp. P6W]|uniref:hypothetical protein n=1 Tax=Novosphingobium sp. P6W TaxID=1609758 RepID=UPI0013B444DC|nr:hypothetical protein [Novosphingobium sp. P6W]